MAEVYVLRLFPPWEEIETTAIVGPFADGEEVAEALEGAGWRRANPSDDPITTWWERDRRGGVQVLPLSKEMPPAG